MPNPEPEPCATTVLPRHAQRVDRWRNGGGATRTVAIDPPGADLGTGFRWRISVADVAQDGPFSSWPGVDRSLWLLAGNGMELRCGPAATVVLRERFQRLDFPGEAPIEARLLDGPTQDLNVMTTRGAVAPVAAIHRLDPGAESRFCDIACEQSVLLVLAGSLRAGGETMMREGDALRRDRPGAIVAAAGADGCTLLAVGFVPIAG
jgi:environmental stress-induced protein Ves